MPRHISRFFRQIALYYPSVTHIQISICRSVHAFKVYRKSMNNSNFSSGRAGKSPNSFLSGLSLSITNQFKLYNRFCLCPASVHLPRPFHLVFGFPGSPVLRTPGYIYGRAFSVRTPFQTGCCKARHRSRFAKAARHAFRFR